MKHSILFLLFVSLIGTPVYNHAASWNKDDLAKIGIMVTGAAAVLYFFTSLSDSKEASSCSNNNELGDFAYQGLGEKSELVSQPEQIKKKTEPAQLKQLTKPVQLKQSEPVRQPKQQKQVEKLIQSKRAVNLRQPQQPDNKKKICGLKKMATPVVDERVSDLSTLKKIENSGLLESITWGHVGCFTGLVFACCVFSVMTANEEIIKADHVTLYENIADDHHFGFELYKRTCATVKRHQSQGILNQKAVSAIITFVTGLRNKLGEHHTAAQSIVCSLDAYKDDISPADMDKLKRLESQSYRCVEKITQVEQLCQGKIGVLALGRELLKGSEAKATKATDVNTSFEGAKREPKNFEEAAAQARSHFAKIEQEKFNRPVVQKQSFPANFFYVVTLPIIMAQISWSWFWNKKRKRDDEESRAMLLCCVE